MNRLLSVAVIAMCFPLLPRPLRSQQTTISVSVKVVNVLATVRDKKGEIVRNLSKDDFVLEEDGRPQSIRYFAQQSELPLILGLLVDTSPSQRRLIGQERSASETFLEQLLREDKDQSFIIHFERDVELLQDLTSSRARLERALGDLGMGSSEQPGGGNWPGRWPGGGRGRGGTSLYDAVFLSSDELMSKQQGRKAVIILSDGVDTSSKKTLASAIEAAQRADTMVYSILFYDEQAYQRGGGGGFGYPGRGGMGRRGGGYPRFPQPTQATHPDGKKVLEQISRETGGRFFQVSKKQPIEQIYATIQEELRNQYNLGYSSDRGQGTGEYRKIHLATRQKELIVQARDGYYAEP